MREDNLLCLRHKSFLVTTQSRHNLPVYPNLAREIRPARVNQLWIADITYIRLRTEFVYLAVLLDAFSRRVIGWALSRTLEAELTLSALRMALRQRRPGLGLVHHSDRGVQYASTDYTDLLREQGIGISMSRTGNPQRQRPGGEFHEDSQVRGNLSKRISRFGGSLRFDEGIHRNRL
jgi:transposase InsO family protein